MNSNYTTLIKNKLNEYSNHPFLNKYFDVPEISSDKIVFLKTILDQTELTEPKKENYILATMLIQTALDAHELVTNELDKKININKNKRQKQLNILVGDLYSGLFYEMLAQLHDIQMINVLAGAIKEINERKMTLYHNDVHSINQLLEEIKRIESLLVTSVSEVFHISSLREIIENWLLMKKLMREQYHYYQKKESRIITLLSEHNEPSHAIRMLENMISRISHTLESYITHLPVQYVELKKVLLEDLRQLAKEQELLLEEG